MKENYSVVDTGTGVLILDKKDNVVHTFGDVVFSVGDNVSHINLIKKGINSLSLEASNFNEEIKRWYTKEVVTPAI